MTDEAMSWTADNAADHLLECLRLVELDQFAGNFATHGITDFSKLAMLERHQFATYGITSAIDVRRLTNLITILRDVRPDAGHVCPQSDAAVFHKTLSVPGDLVERRQQRQLAVGGNRRATGASARRRVTHGQHAARVEYDGPPSFSPLSWRTVSDLPTHVTRSHT